MGEEIIVNIIGTISGGILLAAILFFCNERIFPLKNLSGEWEVSSTTVESSYNAYKNLRLVFVFHLLQKGNELSGSGEKVKEIYENGNVHEFERNKRILLEVEGYYERNIFRLDRVYLNIIEHGQLRTVRTSYILYVHNKTIMSGDFSSTAADSKGIIQMIKP